MKTIAVVIEPLTSFVNWNVDNGTEEIHCENVAHTHAQQNKLVGCSDDVVWPQKIIVSCNHIIWIIPSITKNTRWSHSQWIQLFQCCPNISILWEWVILCLQKDLSFINSLFIRVRQVAGWIFGDLRIVKAGIFMKLGKIDLKYGSLNTFSWTEQHKEIIGSKW